MVTASAGTRQGEYYWIRHRATFWLEIVSYYRRIQS